MLYLWELILAFHILPSLKQIKYSFTIFRSEKNQTLVFSLQKFKGHLIVVCRFSNTPITRNSPINSYHEHIRIHKSSNAYTISQIFLGQNIGWHRTTQTNGSSTKEGVSAEEPERDANTPSQETNKDGHTEKLNYISQWCQPVIKWPDAILNYYIIFLFSFPQVWLCTRNCFYLK